MPLGIAEDRSPGRPRYVLFVLTLIYVFNAMDRNIFSILAEPIRGELHLTDTQLGMLTGPAFALFYTFFGVPVGWLADRIGRIRTIVAACVIWSVCSASGGLATQFLHLALARMGVGIGEAGGAAPSYSLISRYFPPERRAGALGLFHIGSPIATLLISVVSAMIAARYGWRTALVTVSLPGVLVALLLFLTVREPPREGIRGGGPALADSIGAFFRDPLLRLVAVAAGICSFTGYGIAAWLPAYLMRVKGMTLDEFAIYYGAPSALFFGFGLWLSGFAADRLARRTPRAYALVPMAALLLTAPAIAAAVAAPGWPLSLAFWLMPLMLAQMFLAPMLTIIQNRSPDERRSTFSALFLFMNNLIGAGGGPLYVGMISDAAKARYGAQSLGIGLLALIPVALAAAAAQVPIGRRLVPRPGS